MMTSLRGLGPPGDRDLRDLSQGENHYYAMWDAAYVLGALSAAERREFETHMADCPACREAVAELSGMPALLSQLDCSEVAAINEADQTSRVPEVPAAVLPSLLATVRWRRRRTRLLTWTATAAAAVVLAVCVIAGVQGYFTTSPPPQASVSAQPMAQVGTKLLASTVSVSSEHWGTFIDMKCVCLAPLNAHHDTLAMVVVGRDGSQTRLATWVAEPGHTATPAGSISTPVDQIAAVQVVSADNGKLLLERSL
jgi:anti-sigma factor RsiW